MLSLCPAPLALFVSCTSGFLCVLHLLLFCILYLGHSFCPAVVALFVSCTSCSLRVLYLRLSSCPVLQALFVSCSCCSLCILYLGLSLSPVPRGLSSGPVPRALYVSLCPVPRAQFVSCTLCFSSIRYIRYLLLSSVHVKTCSNYISCCRTVPRCRPFSLVLDDKEYLGNTKYYMPCFYCKFDNFYTTLRIICKIFSFP